MLKLVIFYLLIHLSFVQRHRLVIDREKAALNGISPTQISQVLQMAISGQNVGLLHDENAHEDVAINLRFNQSSRTSLADLKALNLKGANGNLVPLSSLVKTENAIVDTSIYHKNLQPVVYALGDVSGRVESSVYAMLALQPKIDKLIPFRPSSPNNHRLRKPMG